MPPARKTGTRARAGSAARSEPRLNRHRLPADMAVDAWQAALRRQYGREQAFELQNLGSDPFFSTFSVFNPASQSRYPVTIRGLEPGVNHCGCWDYATNHLGTCKHIEFTLAVLAKRRGGRRALAAGPLAPGSAVRLDHAGPRRVRFMPGPSCPPGLLASAGQLFDAARGWALPEARLNELEAFVRRFAAAAAKQGHDFVCDDAVWQFAARHRDAAHRRRVFEQAYPKGAADKQLARLLKVKLYRYQAEGALFAATAGRALIGDEMGLGKTIQAIAAAEMMRRHLGIQRVLVVCPTSLKHQWKAEITRFAGHDARVIQGLRAGRAAQFELDDGFKITHYDTLARDADLIQAWAPDLVIADEAQRIKNWNTIAARALKRIESPYAVVLTGTPLENRLEELISIVQFVDQHCLGPTWQLLHRHQQHDDAGRVTGYRDLDRIGQTLAPIMLRRRKAEVLTQLPERVDQRIFVPLTREQRVHHDENGLIVARIVQRWRQTGYLSDTDQRRLQCAMQNMRMACNSTYLLDARTDHGLKVDELMTLLDELFQSPDTKAVVFSQWRGTHELIARRLPERGWGCVRFDGSVPASQRGALVERFHSDPDCRLFLSTDAGGVGLNLQHAAAVVVNMDQPWNPAVLEQRIGRVHRMGQTRGVQVVHLIGQGSIEEGMLGVLNFKSSLSAGILDGGASEVFLSGTRLSRFMKTVQDVTGAMGEAEAADAEPARMDKAVGAEAGAAVAAPLQPEANRAGSQPAPDAVQIPMAPQDTVPPDAGTPAHTPATANAQAQAQAQGATDPWPVLLQAGAAFLQSLAEARAAGQAAPLRVEPDPQTGQPSLRLPLPDAAVLQRLAQALAPWLK